MVRQFVFAAALAVAAGQLSASTITFYGFDQGLGENTRLPSTPNANAARNQFFSNLINVGTEDFEGFSTGASNIMAAFGGGRTATFSGTGNVAHVASGTNGVGRYPISGSKYWESGSNFGITFSEPIAAFGFYGVDVGDFGGQIVLQLDNGGGTIPLNINTPLNQPGGSVVYFGFIRTEGDVVGITFANTASGTDFFGFDDFSIGGLENVQLIPLPTTAGLAIAGMTVLGIRRRRHA